MSSLKTDDELIAKKMQTTKKGREVCRYFEAPESKSGSAWLIAIEPSQMHFNLCNSFGASSSIRTTGHLEPVGRSISRTNPACIRIRIKKLRWILSGKSRSKRRLTFKRKNVNGEFKSDN
jgi:hypothetical protein